MRSVNATEPLEGQPSHRGLLRVLGELISDPALGHITLVLTGRSVPALGGVDAVREMPVLDPETATRYLSTRGVDATVDRAFTDRVIAIAAGNWLVLELATDALISSPGMGAQDLPDLYTNLVDRLHERRGPIVDAVLAVLAAAGTGPVLPFDLLHDALGRLGHRLTRAELHAVLGDPDLHRLTDRTQPGQFGEHLGLFHQTLTDHLTHHPRGRSSGGRDLAAP